ncbi:DUF5343 domain-containing protein [Sinorhizobium americanum]|uniref:DUF5343 domain-containing protein n=1 Tax=Sinorhizobium americanum TaxID=194963 RepID=A0A4R2BX83_9HYPH|nr:DUF5343 domain-containing protein [Sinorhizobium americanum]TCN32491.1 hypothetical protein EV184_104157 [Sinorhizobium americanum]
MAKQPNPAGVAKAAEDAKDVVEEASASSADKGKQREIKGGVPYTPSPGVFKRALEGIIAAERPDKFSPDFMETILHLTGGGARAVPPMLKKMQFLSPDGSPTTLYSKFKTDGGRSQAAYEGLRNAFGELFKRKEFVHRADESAVKDVLVEITGLKKADSIIRLMYATFEAVRAFITADVVKESDAGRETEVGNAAERITQDRPVDGVKLGLSYQINIVLPETENIAVFNAIFKSLRDNLLR